MLYENITTIDTKNNNKDQIYVFISDNIYLHTAIYANYINKRLAHLNLCLIDIESNDSSIISQSRLLNESQKESLLIQIQHQLNTTRSKAKKRRNNTTKSKRRTKTKSKSKVNMRLSKSNTSKSNTPMTRSKTNLEGILKQKENKKEPNESFDDWSKGFMRALSLHLDSIVKRKQDIYTRKPQKRNTSLNQRKKEILNQLKHLKVEQINDIAKNILKIDKIIEGKIEIDLTYHTQSQINELEEVVSQYREVNVKQLYPTINAGNEVNTEIVNQSNNPFENDSLSFSSSLSSSSDSDLSSNDKSCIIPIRSNDFNTNYSFGKRQLESIMNKTQCNQTNNNNTNEDDKDSFGNYTTTSISELNPL